MNRAQSRPTFIDKLSTIGKVGDRVIVPVLNDSEMAELEIATVIDVIEQDPNPFTAELIVRTRIGDGESVVYEPHEIVVLAPSASSVPQATAVASAAA